MSWYQPLPGRSIEKAHQTAKELRACHLSVYDVGAGASFLPDHLLDYNDKKADHVFEVTVLDVSQAALDITAARVAARAKPPNPAPKFIAADITAFEPTKYGECQFWHDRAVLHFLTSPSLVSGYVSTMKRCMKPGHSFAYIAAFALDGPSKCSGLTVQQYSAETLDKALNKEGRWLEIVEDGREEHTTPGGSVQKFTWVLFRDIREDDAAKI